MGQQDIETYPVDGLADGGGSSLIEMWDAKETGIREVPLDLSPWFVPVQGASHRSRITVDSKYLQEFSDLCSPAGVITASTIDPFYFIPYKVYFSTGGEG